MAIAKYVISGRWCPAVRSTENGECTISAARIRYGASPVRHTEYEAVYRQAKARTPNSTFSKA